MKADNFRCRVHRYELEIQEREGPPSLPHDAATRVNAQAMKGRSDGAIPLGDVCAPMAHMRARPHRVRGLPSGTVGRHSLLLALGLWAVLVGASHGPHGGKLGGKGYPVLHVPGSGMVRSYSLEVSNVVDGEQETARVRLGMLGGRTRSGD